ncbi:MAG: hypothetical protein ABID64_00215 [Nitrospirota bacterium]|nr:hypothetical protein [Patescibacteria group bacterium]
MTTEEHNNTNNKDKHFKGQHPQEEVEVFCRKHWIVLAGPTFLYGVFIVAFVLFLVLMKKVTFIDDESFVYQGLFIVALALATYYVNRYFVRLYNFFLNVVIVTNFRIVDLNKSLILHDTKEVIDIAKIQNVNKLQDGLFRNLLSYGQLVITLSSSSAIKNFYYIPNPNFHFRVINRKKREYVFQKMVERRQTYQGIEPVFPVQDANPYAERMMAE